MRLLPYCLLIGALAWLSGLLVLGCSASAFPFSSGTGGGYSSTGGTTGGSAGSSFSTGFGGQVFVSSGSNGAGGSSSTAGGDAGVPPSGAGGGGGATSASGDCDTGADCPSGSCVAVTPGGFRVCFVPPVVATTCTSSQDQCCSATTQPCQGSVACDVGPLVPTCTASSTPYNQCAMDQCAADADCASGQICAPAGTLGLGVRACVAAACKVDTDCTAYPGGICAPVQEPCCSATAGLYCEYPGYGGCRRSSDCPSTSAYPNQTCVPDVTTGVASCQDSGPVCPS